MHSEAYKEIIHAVSDFLKQNTAQISFTNAAVQTTIAKIKTKIETGYLMWLLLISRYNIGQITRRKNIIHSALLADEYDWM